MSLTLIVLCSERCTLSAMMAPNCEPICSPRSCTHAPIPSFRRPRPRAIGPPITKFLQEAGALESARLAVQLANANALSSDIDADRGPPAAGRRRLGYVLVRSPR